MASKGRRSAILYYPIAVNIKGRLAVVIGGGKVAERKVINLLQANAHVKVVSPALTKTLKRLVSQRKLRWIPRCARRADINTACVVIAAAGDSAASGKASRWARKKGILVNVVDNSRLSDFISPAVWRWGGAIFAVHTNGRDPALSRDLKNFLKEKGREFLSFRRRLQKSIS